MSDNKQLLDDKSITKAWKDAGIFEKSVEKNNPQGDYIFFDGPPFANGLPHYGHLLTGFVKDVFARYHTMFGKRCERKFGWDCHGLPAEMEAEKELKITGRLAIKDFSGNAKSQSMSHYALETFMKTEEYKGLLQQDRQIIADYIDKLKRGEPAVCEKTASIMEKTQFYKSIPDQIFDENGKKLEGIAAFNEHCRSSVMKYTNEWEDYVTKQGRWVDFENSYKTMDLPYMQSVISAFGKLFEKGLIYESTRVMAYSWKCQTPLSNFETKMDNSYREKESKTCVVKFRLTNESKIELQSRIKVDLSSAKNAYFLAWTTTPWTLPSNLALAVGRDIEYSIIPSGEDVFIMAESLISKYSKDIFKGEDAHRFLIQNLIQNGKKCDIDAKINDKFRVDIVLPEQNLVIEIKSDEKSKIEFEKTQKKQLEDLGYKVLCLTAQNALNSVNVSKILDFADGRDVNFDIPHTVITGEILETLAYEPLFPYFKDTQNAFRVLVGDFVGADDGTGIVHMAPGFGEDDFALCRANQIPVVCPIDDGGCFNDSRIVDLTYTLGQKSEVLKLAGRCVLEESTNEKGKKNYDGVNEDVIKYLKSQNLWLKTEQYLHNYPHCWRTDTPLIYKAVSSWYVNVAGDGQGEVKIETTSGKKTVKERMIELNQGINWIPDHIRDGQFGRWIEGARDWSISRNRFFGCPIPVWKNHYLDGIYDRKCLVFNSISDMEKEFEKDYVDLYLASRGALCDVKSTIYGTLGYSIDFKNFSWKYITKEFKNHIENGKNADLYQGIKFKITDLHRPYVDELIKPILKDGSCVGYYSRIEDVFDCWFESGSMPFASVGFTFGQKNQMPHNFPADFIVEYVAQTRGWFYTLMILGTALFDKAPFKNCICHGVILDANGQKLSKRLRNYPDPMEMFDKYGSDAMRWFLLSSPVMRGGDLYMDETGEQIRDVSRTVITPFLSAFNFFKTYAKIDNIKCENIIEKTAKLEINRYILSLTVDTIAKIKTAIENYDTPSACSAFEEFLESLNNFYIRRNKDVFWESGISEGKQESFNTLYSVLLNVSLAIAPLAPFTTEVIFDGIGA